MDQLSIMTDQLSRLYLAEKAAFCIETPEPEYVLHIDVAVSSSSAKIAATSTNYNVRIYSADSLAFTSNINAHKQHVSGVKFSPDSESLLFTSSHDGTVQSWDMRCGFSKSTQTYTNCSDQFNNIFTALDVNCEASLICAGTEAKGDDVQVLLWDIRKPDEQLRHFNDSHTDDVTSVRFHPEKSNILLSGSTDGLVNIYDITETDEDDVLISTLNTESSVSRTGFCGKNHSFIYALTHIESLQLWESEEEFDDVVCLTDIREKYADKSIDYLVDCFQCSWFEDNICLIVGSNSGQGHVMSLQGQELRHECSMSEGHKDVIRSMVWSQSTGTLITGGEDSMLCAWSRTQKDQAASAKLKDKRKSGSKVKKKVKRKIRDSTKPF